MSTFIYWISYVAVFFSLTGNFFVNRKQFKGMVFWTIGSLIWVFISIYNSNFSQLILFGVYTYFNIDGMVRWSKRD